jgi:hypothetical protein
VYTQKRDVTQRLKQLFSLEGIQVEVLTTEVPPERREAWYEDKLGRGMQVCIAHPRLIMTGLDLLETPSIFFYETGYSTHVLRQASRRSWRIGQRRPVRVCFMSYADTAQERCLRLMGKKMQVSLALEGKLASHGLTDTDSDDDILTALARELVTQKGIGECAAAVWKSLQRSNTFVSAQAPQTAAAEAELDIFQSALGDDEPLVRRPPQANVAEQLTFSF